MSYVANSPIKVGSNSSQGQLKKSLYGTSTAYMVKN